MALNTSKYNHPTPLHFKGFMLLRIYVWFYLEDYPTNPVCGSHWVVSYTAWLFWPQAGDCPIWSFTDRAIGQY